MRVFPGDQLKIITLEDYRQNKTNVVTDVIHFLEIGTLYLSNLKHVVGPIERNAYFIELHVFDILLCILHILYILESYLEIIYLRFK